MDVTIEKVKLEEKPVLAALLKVMHHREDDPEYEYSHLAEYWTDKDRIPYFILADGEIAGLILIDKYMWVLAQEETNRAVAEIYVKPEFRGQGVARSAMFLVWDRYPGAWEVRPLEGSLDAQAFWEKTIGAYTGGNFKTTCFGRYRRPIYSLQVPAVEQTGHEIVYRPAYGEPVDSTDYLLPKPE